MTVVATQVRIGHQTALDILRIFERQIEGGGKRLPDIAGGAEPLADNDAVRMPQPFLRLLGGKPLVADFSNGILQ